MSDTKNDALQSRLLLAERVARAGGEKALAYFNQRDTLVVETKHDLQDVVSRADREVEQMIDQQIRASFPDDGFLGEEYGLQPGTSGYTWVVDPIDGTSPFLNGMPNWCVSVAVLHDGVPVIGRDLCADLSGVLRRRARPGRNAEWPAVCRWNPSRTLQNHVTRLWR